MTRKNRKSENQLPSGVTPLLLDKRQVAALLSLGERTVDKLVSAGDLPKPLKRGRSSLWRYADVVAYANTLTS